MDDWPPHLQVHNPRLAVMLARFLTTPYARRHYASSDSDVAALLRPVPNQDPDCVMTRSALNSRGVTPGCDPGQHTQFFDSANRYFCLLGNWRLIEVPVIRAAQTGYETIGVQSRWFADELLTLSTNVASIARRASCLQVVNGLNAYTANDVLADAADAFVCSPDNSLLQIFENDAVTLFDNQLVIEVNSNYPRLTDPYTVVPSHADTNAVRTLIRDFTAWRRLIFYDVPPGAGSPLLTGTVNEVHLDLRFGINVPQGLPAIPLPLPRIGGILALRTLMYEFEGVARGGHYYARSRVPVTVELRIPRIGTAVANYQLKLDVLGSDDDGVTWFRVGWYDQVELRGPGVTLELPAYRLFYLRYAADGGVQIDNLPVQLRRIP